MSPPDTTAGSDPGFGDGLDLHAGASLPDFGLVGRRSGGTAATDAAGITLEELLAAGARDDVSTNLDGITVESRKTTVLSRAPWELGQLVPQNTADKRDAYKGYVEADRAVATAEGKVANARQVVAEKEKALAVGKPGAEKALNQARQGLASAEQTCAAAVAKRDGAEAKLREVLKHLAPEHAAKIDAFDFRKHAVDRDVATVTVGGTKIEMHDAIDAYSTVSQDGLKAQAAGEDRDGVEAKINDAPISDSKKAVFKSVSNNEGTFSEANTYDVAGLTYGFIQMTSKGVGGSLGNLFEHVKTTDPETFKRQFQDYGIDYDTRKNEFTLTLPGGQILRGQAAVDKICTDPKYVGVLCAAGTDGKFQSAQIAFASKKLDTALEKTAVIDTGDGRHQEIRASDILTSELAVGLYFDRCVQNGEGLSRGQGAGKPEKATGAIGQLDRVITSYLNKHPGADLSQPEIRQAIELEYIAWAQHNYGERAKSFTKNNASAEPGSYKT